MTVFRPPSSLTWIFVFAATGMVVLTLLHRVDSFVVQVGKLPTLPPKSNKAILSHATTTTTNTALYGMKRPILDQIATTLFRLETSRVENSSVSDEKGRVGEPMEWSESSSFANKFSEFIASNSIGYTVKQWVADIIAGNDYDQQQTIHEIDEFVATNKVAMFSFTSCPFCRRAKDLLDEKGVDYSSMELDELDGNKGNEIRAMLGRKTKRTSVPAIFIDGQYIGGCNDGPGLLPLNESGELDELLFGK